MGSVLPETIPASRVRLARNFVLLAAALAVAVAALYFVPFGALGIGLFQGGAFRLGILTVVVGLAIGFATLVWLAVLGQVGYNFCYPHQLVLDESEFRYVRRGRSGEIVKARFPYSNIANVRGAKANARLPLSITLHDAADPNTELSDEDRRKAGLNRPIRLPGGWTVPVGEIAERLKARCRNLGQKSGPTAD